VLGCGLPGGFGSLCGLTGPVCRRLHLFRQGRPAKTRLDRPLGEPPGVLGCLSRGSAGGGGCRVGPPDGIADPFGCLSRALHVSRCRSGLRRLGGLAGLGGACLGRSGFLVGKVRGLCCLIREFTQLGSCQRRCGMPSRQVAGRLGLLHRLFRTISRNLSPL
jgi:hypothetical protein